MPDREKSDAEKVGMDLAYMHERNQREVDRMDRENDALRLGSIQPGGTMDALFEIRDRWIPALKSIVNEPDKVLCDIGQIEMILARVIPRATHPARSMPEDKKPASVAEQHKTHCGNWDCPICEGKCRHDVWLGRRVCARCGEFTDGGKS